MSSKTFINSVINALNTQKSPAAAAKAIHALCVKECAEVGMKPAIEVLIKKPGERRFNGHDKVWTVAWESCPYYEWAVIASCNSGTNPSFIAEPHYSFDLNFFPQRAA